MKNGLVDLNLGKVYFDDLMNGQKLMSAAEMEIEVLEAKNGKTVSGSLLLKVNGA